MPRARKRASSPVQVAEPEPEAQGMEEDNEAAQQLQFNEPLTWRAGKAIPVADLLARLRRLYEELAPMQQEDADRETLVPVAQELANGQLLGHRDKGVKASAMRCIVHVFRLLAPDAPYRERQLKDIFSLFVSTIIPALANPTDPYSKEHLHVLASLASFKSIALLTDIPGSENLIVTLFTNCFDILSGVAKGGTGEQLPKNVEYHMTSMLCTLVDECATLPTGVVDIILAQFLRADPNTFFSQGKKSAESQAQMVVKEVSPAYNMARSVCNTCSEKMGRVVGQYFSSVLVDASETATLQSGVAKTVSKRKRDDDDDASEDGLLTPPAEDDLREAEKAHRLLRELWRSCPDVVPTVVQQIEAEISAENVFLRRLAVETIGDMIAGIGAAGPPLSRPLEPAAYPSQSLDIDPAVLPIHNILTVPAAPHAFSSIYPTAYQAFIDRRRDKTAQVRSVWVTEVGRIIRTSAGGKGLDADEETRLLRYLSNMLVDIDEKVRLAAVNAIGRFDFNCIVQRIGASGGVSEPGSVLSNLADRIKDKRHHVSRAAMILLARIWGVASGAIAEGSERIATLLGAIPSKILEAVYVNDHEINALVQEVLYSSLLPLSYPPLKPKSSESHRVQDSQNAAVEPDPDAVRVERILVLVRGLEPKAKTVFLRLQERQAANARYLEALLKAFEAYNGGVMEMNEQETKKKLDKLIAHHPGPFHDADIAAEHLRKFAKMHDRRSYQLIRFCMSPQSDYRKVLKATKELTKRMEEGPGSQPVLLETIMPIVRGAAVLVYNKSHVPAIMEISRTDEKGLGQAAHETLKEISMKAPEVFKVHVHELCRALVDQAPTKTAPNDPGAVDVLKACAGFARSFPAEMPQDRNFHQAMTEFAVRGTPAKAAKYAVTVLMSSAEKKEMYAKDILQRCIKNFEYGRESFLSKLAALSQLRLLASNEIEVDNDAIMEIAIQKILTATHTPASDEDPDWDNHADPDLEAKIWALKILVNGLRGYNGLGNSEEAPKTLREIATPVYKLLNTIVEKEGELSKTSPTPTHHKSQLRLTAAVHLLKLCNTRASDAMLTPRDFNRLTRIVQDPLPEVRHRFAKALKKYLGAGKLPNRFYALVFCYAWEPNKEMLTATANWLRGRAGLSTKPSDTVMESCLARFLSLLAHHQDFSADAKLLEDFVRYIMFYLQSIATEENLPLIYYYAQRLKTVQDGIDADMSENLYVLSDLAEAVVRCYQDLQGWSLQLYGGKAKLPMGLFAQMPSHAVAQEVSEKQYVPDELRENLDDLVRECVKSKKRKSDGSSGQARKKVKADGNGDTVREKRIAKAVSKKSAAASKLTKTPRKRAASSFPSSERRKSGRTPGGKNYAEPDDSEDDVEMERWDAEIAGADEDKENLDEGSTPPTSDPVDTTEAAGAPKMVDRGKPARREVPTRAGRAARSRKRHVMDVPSDSDAELSDAPESDE